MFICYDNLKNAHCLNSYIEFHFFFYIISLTTERFQSPQPDKYFCFMRLQPRVNGPLFFFLKHLIVGIKMIISNEKYVIFPSFCCLIFFVLFLPFIDLFSLGLKYHTFIDDCRIYLYVRSARIKTRPYGRRLAT